ncbi:saccharopine dehydrogenase family protein [Alphaproteobacteria bacterium]|jgi:saccharopine dehydrogenase (NAD+, L-lysine-forming)|nr:saccharopine dehydrogenase family protein [Alphaproteobacteria bacterium]MDB2618038.1 saccharopine dehydrogenase family protein [Alphaproteobacteria bacterium]MDC0968922.1 saccharopine dehydrogenase family protein [Alphaproteobacteria bacterium]MDC3410199.1 saccharopine dehydrogenase family protein [Alphaproteobacteria bacterium]
MNTVLVIGAGGVSHVTIHKMASVSITFNKIVLASRTIDKCEAIKKSVKNKYNVDIEIVSLDADNINETISVIKKYNPFVVVNLALPYQDLNIMEACLSTNTHYLDTANYEPKDDANFEYKWQWDFQQKFKKKGIMALLGSGFDPGVTNVFTAHTKKHYLDNIEFLDILDCNDGDHGHPFATNFNPEINIREVTSDSKHWENNEWKIGPALKNKVSFDFPEIGSKNMYLMYHEELESLVKHFPEIKRARFWMTFGDNYLKHLEVLENIGMTSIKPINYNGTEIVPLQFLKSILPDPGSLGSRTKGKTCIGTIITGTKNNIEKTFYTYNICDHEKCFEEVGSQAISYTTGVPAMIGTMLMLEKKWFQPGVWNMEQFNPDPFMKLLNQYGLPTKTIELSNRITF